MPTKAEHDRLYYQRHRDAVRSRAAGRYAHDPEAQERARVRATAWNRANRERRRWIIWKHEALARGAVFVEDIDPNLVFERDSRACQICGEAVAGDRWVLDHIVPAAAGGEHSYANVRVAHFDCNRMKGIVDDRRLVRMLKEGSSYA